MVKISIWSKFGPETKLQRKSDVLFNKIEKEVIILSIEKSEYISLNKIGSQIWDYLQYPLTFNELVNKLIEKYQVSKERCVGDTIIFIEKLLSKNLIYAQEYSDL